MRTILLTIACFFIANYSLFAQITIVDATDQSPVSAASIFDSSGNMVGFTWSDGTLSEIPDSSYPITIRCLGYEQLTIDTPKEQVWAMTPSIYELDEVVVVPVERNILKQLFYVREYFSMNFDQDTISFFVEHMADRFVPTKKGTKFKESASLRILASRNYARYRIEGKDSVMAGAELGLPSLLSIVDLNNEAIKAPKSFKTAGNAPQYYEEKGKSGAAHIMKQNSQTFTSIEDALALKKGHTWTPWSFKLLGYTTQINQLYFTHAYRRNEEGTYLPKDLTEASFVMDALGSGKRIRKAFDSDEPIAIKTMIELYIVDRDFLSTEEAKDEYNNKPTSTQFIIPEAVPALNKATQELIEQANAK